MSHIQPIYTPSNTRFAYQLNWSLSLFWRRPSPDSNWLGGLTHAVEPDGVRILQHRFSSAGVSQFFLSTQPHVSPLEIVRSVKGRLQHILGAGQPKAFRRNYGLRSIGAARQTAVEQYISSQIDHHPMADTRMAQQLRQHQISRPEVDLLQPRQTAHAQYWYNLHVVLVNDGRWREVREDWLRAIRKTILQVAERRGYLLSKAAVLPDHVHLALGGRVGVSPSDVALCYMNNLAWAVGMRAVFQYSCYVGTFGEYDRGVVGREGR